jgi:hypothetical protein
MRSDFTSPTSEQGNLRNVVVERTEGNKARLTGTDRNGDRRSIWAIGNFLQGERFMSGRSKDGYFYPND